MNGLMDFGVLGSKSPGGLLNLSDLFGKKSDPAPAAVTAPVNITLPASAGISPNMLMLGGLGLAAIFMLSRK